MLYEGAVSSKAKEIAEKYDAHFHFYPMPILCKSYIASVKPYGMWRLFQEQEINEPIFYHDADIIFHTLPDFRPLLKGNKSYMSATLQRGGKSYVDLDYLSQFKGVVDGLTNIIGVEPKPHGGGAQYVLKGTTKDYWEKVYHDCFKVYEFLRDSGTKVQVWCAEMWATLWNVWYFGKDIELHPLLDFCMARDPIEELKPIVHNAGLMEAGYFNKLAYQNTYPPFDLQVKKDLCNAIYYENYRILEVRPKFTTMGKIKFIKAGAFDKDTNQEYKIGDIADLGTARNNNAVKGGYAEHVEAEKKEGAPKTTKRTKK